MSCPRRQPPLIVGATALTMAGFGRFRGATRVELGEKDRVRVALGTTLPDCFVLFLGTHEPRKNLAALLEAHRLAAPDLPLIIAGPDGWGESVRTDSGAAVRAIGRVPGGPCALRRRDRIGLPEPARGFRSSGSGGDGAGDGGHQQRHHVDGGGGRRHRCAGRPDRPQRARRRARSVASDPDAWVERGRRASQQAALFTWAATGAALGAVYDEVAA